MSPGRLKLPIETSSLTLRELVPGDVVKVYRMSREEGIRAWLPSQVYRDEAHAAAVVAFLVSQYTTPGDPRLGPYVLGVRLNRTGDLIGHVGLSPLGEDVEIGFAIESAHQRKGFATEAVRAACEWAVDKSGLATIVGVTAAQNNASQGVLMQAGFDRMREEVVRFQGREQPVIVFAYEGR